MTQTDQMNEMSFRSDEQAQSQDRERLQSEIQEAWDHVMKDCQRGFRGMPSYAEQPEACSEADLRLLRWRLGVK